MALWIGGTAESMFFCLNSIEAALGRNGRNAILRYAHLEKYIAVSPENDPALALSPDDLAILTKALLDIAGAECALLILRRAGRAVGNRLVRRGLGRKRGLRRRSPLERLERALTELEKGLRQAKHDVEEHNLVQRVTLCPYCHGISADQPVCRFHEGLLEALAQEIVGDTCTVYESTCQAMGSRVCLFIIRGLPLTRPALGGVELHL